mmetsp:Transcript_12429/g.14223  ORF Transcript_12429/g.14223 Transcript_12429/m.14223 type:complete len:98 (+) Transcript_12429:321-614(+)
MFVRGRDVGYGARTVGGSPVVLFVQVRANMSGFRHDATVPGIGGQQCRGADGVTPVDRLLYDIQGRVFHGTNAFVVLSEIKLRQRRVEEQFEIDLVA